MAAPGKFKVYEIAKKYLAQPYDPKADQTAEANPQGN